jgi:hypothetical protein
MQDSEGIRIKRLLDRLFAARARRDAELRGSDRWHALDAELHAIERDVFRSPEADADAAANDEPAALDRAG